ncbi:AKR2A [Symbiodinium necroappetens]|uniref:AKR2A protein n=1 Tax=Symbiodinium necroappetens TaxID=1628268 RepID=A0A813BGG0_9DINO|nr:AKR2A [Symbiodinium necroappetens]
MKPLPGESLRTWNLKTTPFRPSDQDLTASFLEIKPCQARAKTNAIADDPDAKSKACYYDKQQPQDDVHLHLSDLFVMLGVMAMGPQQLSQSQPRKKGEEELDFVKDEDGGYLEKWQPRNAKRAWQFETLAQATPHVAATVSKDVLAVSKIGMDGVSLQVNASGKGVVSDFNSRGQAAGWLSGLAMWPESGVMVSPCKVIRQQYTKESVGKVGIEMKMCRLCFQDYKPKAGVGRRPLETILFSNRHLLVAAGCMNGKVQERVSTFQMQQNTGDGLILALVRTRDQIFSDTLYTEDTTHEVLQLVLVLWLHAASLTLQFGLTYHLYFTTVDGLAAPFSSGITDKMEAIRHALDHDPPVPLSKDDLVQKDALDLCLKQHALGLTHLMVLSLWGARMVAEVSELLNSGTILSLIADPDPTQNGFLEERDDGKMLVSHMSLMMKVACIILVIIPKLVCTSFLMWTGGKMFMLTHTMGSLIIPLLTLTYILQIPAILFTGFSSFKFKEKVQLTLYQYKIALCYNSANCQMWGLTVIKAAATFCYVYFIYVLAFGDVTELLGLHLSNVNARSSEFVAQVFEMCSERSIMAETATAPTETLKISDGTTMQIARLPDIDDNTWAEVKAYVEGNPETAKALQSFAKNPEAMRGWLQTQAIAEHYNTKLSNGDAPVADRVKSLEKDPELASVFEDIKKNGMEAAMKYYQDEELMLKISQKMGGLPSELQPVLKKIDETALTLHEAAKNGDLKAVQDHKAKKFGSLQLATSCGRKQGITALGYAIGANRIAVVKLLLDSRANPYAVDSSGNSGLHYAAGYGRKELLEYLLKVGANATWPPRRRA